MKKIYLLSLSLFAAGALNAQTVGADAQIKHELNTDPQSVESRPQTLGVDRAPDDIIWTDGFENAADWTATGPSGDYDINGWSIGADRHGWYFAGGPMGTTGNFARFVNGTPPTDAEPNPADPVVENGPFTLEWTGTPIDLTGVPAPHLEFEHSGARFITLQAVEVSTNGGSSWTEVGNNDEIDPVTLGGGSAYGIPDTRRFNITAAVAGDPSNVSIRLLWDGAQNGPNMNYIEYGWYVDDIRVVEGYSVDSDIQGAYFRSGVGLSYEYGLEYYMVPTTQITAIDMIGETINQGGSTFTNAYLEATVDNGGNVFTGTSVPADIPSAASDSVSASTQFTPASGIGTYDMSWIFLGTETDDFNSNDVMTDAFEVTEYTYGRDNGVSTGAIGNVTSNDGLGMLIGNTMDIFADGFIGAIDVRISSASSNVEQFVYGQISKYSDDAGEWQYLEETEEYEIQNSDLNGFVKLVFDDPVQVFAGDLILVMGGHYGGDPEVEFSYAQGVEVQTVLGYTAGSAAPFSLNNPDAIMVRADMRDFTGINDSETDNFSIGQNVPNPFDDNSIINYSLVEASDVSVEFVDAAGKVVKQINQGNQAAGKYSINVNSTDFAEGIYFYTFTVGEKQITKRMVVSK